MGVEMLEDSENPFMTYQDPKSFSAGDSAWSFDSTCSESTAGGSTASSVKVYIWALENVGQSQPNSWAISWSGSESVIVASFLTGFHYYSEP